MKVVMIDNYDSFTYNLVQYLGECGADVTTYRNDQVDVNTIQSLNPDRLVISPGPGNPGNNPGCLGVGMDALKSISKDVPTLGVCLGCQGIGALFGASIISAKHLMHGKSSTIKHDGKGVFFNLQNPLKIARYHSLALDIDTIPDELKITTQTEDGEVMGVRHRDYPIEGVQFHPESILTEQGLQMIQNFLDQTSEN